MSLLLNALKKAEEGDKSQAEEVSPTPTLESSGTPVTEEGVGAASAAAVDFDSMAEEDSSESANVSDGEEKRKRIDAARVFGAGEGGESGQESAPRSPFKKPLLALFGIVLVGGGGYFTLVSGLIPGLDISSLDQMLGRQSAEATQASTQGSGAGELTISEDVVLLPIPAVDVQSEVDFAALRLPENSRERLGDKGYGERIAILTGYDIDRELARQEEEERALRLALDAEDLESVSEDDAEDQLEIADESSEKLEPVLRTADASRESKAIIDAKTAYDQVLDVVINDGSGAQSLGESSRVSESKGVEVAQIEVGLSKEGIDRQRLLNQARQLYYSGSYVEAETVYRNVLLSDATNLDALRGLAQVAVVTRRYQAAIATYLDILNYYPGDPIAIAELTNLRGGGGEGFYEIEQALKKALGKMPAADARLYFALGNLYAENERWLDAQEAYFDAVSRESSNPDYSYNLAVVLDYLNKSSLAVQYYREALDLSDGVLVGFDRAEVKSRIADFE